MARRFLSPEETEAFKEAYSRGDSLDAMAARFGIETPGAVAVRAKRLGCRRPGRILWTEERLQETFRFLCEGYDRGELAALYGVTRIALRNVCNRTWVGAAVREKLGVERMPPIRFWTKTRREELARFYRLELSRAEMARRLGCTVQSIRHQADVQGLADRERGRRIMAHQRRGKKHTKKALQIMSEKAQARWADPAYVAKQNAPDLAAVRSHQLRQANENRRGFHVPDDKLDDYRFMRERKRYSAAEAGAALGLTAGEAR